MEKYFLYQGKRIDNGEWVKGNVLTNGRDYDCEIRICDKTAPDYGTFYIVDPDTVSEIRENGIPEPFASTLHTVSGEIKGEWHIDNTKVRENGLHTPKLDVKTTEDYTMLSIHCSVCNKLLAQSTEYYPVIDDYINSYTDRVAPNYCPHCGARLKEID